MNNIIVAIGGGKLGLGDTLPIDKSIKQFTDSPQPKALFIPTASYDDTDYTDTFNKIYKNELGCETEVLYLLKNPPTYSEIKQRIKEANLIYVGGGNTLKMMRRWRHLGVAPLLKKAFKAGTVCCGLSAGALCWFLYGHSDSMYYYQPESQWSYIRVRGLGLIPLTLCPHYDGEDRQQYFHNMIFKKGHTGVALDDNCALIIRNNKYRIQSSQPNAQAYKVIKYKGKIYQTTLPATTRYRPLEELTYKYHLFALQE